MIGHRIHRDTDGALRAVVLVKPKKRGLLSLLNRSAGSRLTLAILISGLVCYALSRALTQRLRRLQLAARQLTGGDLSARVAVRDTGGDETDELGRNFNAMAAQLNEKIHIQNDTLTIVGISKGTNAFVIQYAFVTLKKAKSLKGEPTMSS